MTCGFAGVFEGGRERFFCFGYELWAVSYEREFVGRKGWRVDGVRAVSGSFALERRAQDDSAKPARARTGNDEMRGSLHCALRAPVGMTRYRLRAAVGMTVLRWNPTHRDKTAMNGAPGTRR